MKIMKFEVENYNNIKTDTETIEVDTVTDKEEAAMFDGFLKKVRRLSDHTISETMPGGKLPRGVIQSLGDFLARDIIKTISKADLIEPYKIESFRVNTPLSVIITAFTNASSLDDYFAMSKDITHENIAWCDDAYREIDEFKKMKRTVRKISPNHTSYRFSSYTMADLFAIADSANAILRRCISDDTISVRINVDMWALVDTYSEEDTNKKHPSTSVNLRTAFETLIGD